MTLFSFHSFANTTFTRTQVLMGDVPVSMTIRTAPSRESKAYQAMERAYETARKIESEVSEWNPQSHTSLLNHNAGRAWVPVGNHLMFLLEKAFAFSEKTEGAFDITFSSPRKNASYRDIKTIPELSLAFLPQGTKIALSGIAKGYIVDQMSAVLKQHGFRNFLINAGDIYAAGKWKIGIRDPAFPGQDRILCEITVKNKAISTSGTYERGRHLIDPKTKKPVSTALKSVTVTANSSLEADVWAKALFISGRREYKILPYKVIPCGQR